MQPDAWPVAVICGSCNLILALLLEKTNVFRNLHDGQEIILLGFSTMFSMFTVVYLLYSVTTLIIAAIAGMSIYLLYRYVADLREYLETLFALSVIGIFCGVAFRILWLFVEP